MRTRRRPAKPLPRRAARKKPRSKAGRIALVGVGSQLRGDDAAGVMTVLKLAAVLRRNPAPRLKAFDGGTAPENITGEILRFLGGKTRTGSHVILIDAADMKLAPGQMRTLPRESLVDFSLSTHRLPLNILADYLIQSAGCGVTVIGIQPKNTDYREGMSPKLKASVKRLVGMLRDGSWRDIPVVG